MNLAAYALREMANRNILLEYQFSTSFTKYGSWVFTDLIIYLFILINSGHWLVNEPSLWKKDKNK